MMDDLTRLRWERTDTYRSRLDSSDQCECRPVITPFGYVAEPRGQVLPLDTRRIARAMNDDEMLAAIEQEQDEAQGSGWWLVWGFLSGCFWAVVLYAVLS